MKEVVGIRAEIPDKDARDALTLVNLFFPGAVAVNQRQYPGQCKNCGLATVCTLTEERKTGRIWFEGPDSCSNCGHRFVTKSPPNVSLSQEAIKALFG